MDDALLTGIVDLALRWRYDHPGHAEISRDQQMVDGGELLTLLRKHHVHIPMDFAMKEISAPGMGLPESPVVHYSALDRSCDAYCGMGT